MTGVVTPCFGSISEADLDPRTTVPDVCREARQTVIDQIRGNPPTTVLGVLVERRGPVAVRELGEKLGKSQDEIDWTVEVLEEGDLCARVVKGGEVFAAPFAPYALEKA